MRQLVAGKDVNTEAEERSVVSHYQATNSEDEPRRLSACSGEL
jgi:hypothetical protein